MDVLGAELLRVRFVLDSEIEKGRLDPNRQEAPIKNIQVLPQETTMNIISSFKQGVALVSRTKRMILFAWFVNVLFALVLALPVLKQLDSYLRDTVMDEKVLRQMDPGWVESYRADMEKSEFLRSLDNTIYGYGPFVNHLELQMNGAFVKTLGDFLYDFFLRWEINPAATSLLFLLCLLYVCTSTFLAGGFIGIYSKEYRSTFTEFLMDGAKYFGKFFRLSLIALLVYYLFFVLVVGWINAGIPRWTQNEASETVPFAYYMIRNVAVLFSLSILFMIFDYARIRMVVDDRISAFSSTAAGIRFAFSHFPSTYGLYLLLILVGVLLIVVYAILEKVVPQESYWPLVLLFVIQQIYMLARFFLKGSFYACQTGLYQTETRLEHAKNLSTVSPTT